MTRDPAILVINAGSSSVKFASFADAPALARLWSGAIERIGLANARMHVADAGGATIGEETRPSVETGRAACRERV